MTLKSLQHMTSGAYFVKLLSASPTKKHNKQELETPKKSKHKTRVLGHAGGRYFLLIVPKFQRQYKKVCNMVTSGQLHETFFGVIYTPSGITRVKNSRQYADSSVNYARKKLYEIGHCW